MKRTLILLIVVVVVSLSCNNPTDPNPSSGTPTEDRRLKEVITRSYSPEGSIIYEQENVYDSSGKIQSSAYTNYQYPQESYTSYTYDGSTQTIISFVNSEFSYRTVGKMRSNLHYDWLESYDQSNSLVSVLRYRYDKDGYLLSSTHEDSRTGEIYYSEEYEWLSQRISKATSFDRNGDVVRLSKYHWRDYDRHLYDEYSIYDSNNNLTLYTDYEYDSEDWWTLVETTSSSQATRTERVFNSDKSSAMEYYYIDNQLDRYSEVLFTYY